MSLVIAITGYPGVGKLTVARSVHDALERDGRTTRVIDNHWINNPIFGLVEQDGVSPLPREVWDRVGEVARAVFRTVDGITPREWDVVFTAYLDGESDAGWMPSLARIAQAREAVLVPVRLLCDPDENARRIVQPERRALMKSVDPDEPHRLAGIGQPYDPGVPNTLTLDVTSLSPNKAAEAILTHAAGIQVHSRAGIDE